MPRLIAGACLALLAAGAAAQEREDRTLLGTDQMQAIVNEASGERAMHHVLELVPYPRVRPPSEYEGHFRESEVMARLAKEYGFSNVEIESFPSPQRLWQPTRGELWLTSPQTRKLYDIHDVAVSLGANSGDGDLAAEVVDVGVGARAEDYAGRDVKGKISPILFAVAIPVALVAPIASMVIYAGVVVLWLVPDRRMERAMQADR